MGSTGDLAEPNILPRIEDNGDDDDDDDSPLPGLLDTSIESAGADSEAIVDDDEDSAAEGGREVSTGMNDTDNNNNNNNNNNSNNSVDKESNFSLEVRETIDGNNRNFADQSLTPSIALANEVTSAASGALAEEMFWSSDDDDDDMISLTDHPLFESTGPVIKEMTYVSSEEDLILLDLDSESDNVLFDIRWLYPKIETDNMTEPSQFVNGQPKRDPVDQHYTKDNLSTSQDASDMLLAAIGDPEDERDFAFAGLPSADAVNPNSSLMDVESWTDDEEDEELFPSLSRLGDDSQSNPETRSFTQRNEDDRTPRLLTDYISSSRQSGSDGDGEGDDRNDELLFSSSSDDDSVAAVAGEDVLLNEVPEMRDGHADGTILAGDNDPLTINSRASKEDKDPPAIIVEGLNDSVSSSNAVFDALPAATDEEAHEKNRVNKNPHPARFVEVLLRGNIDMDSTSNVDVPRVVENHPTATAEVEGANGKFDAVPGSDSIWAELEATEGLDEPTNNEEVYVNVLDSALDTISGFGSEFSGGGISEDGRSQATKTTDHRRDEIVQAIKTTDHRWDDIERLQSQVDTLQNENVELLGRLQNLSAVLAQRNSDRSLTPTNETHPPQIQSDPQIEIDSLRRDKAELLEKVRSLSKRLEYYEGKKVIPLFDTDRTTPEELRYLFGKQHQGFETLQARVAVLEKEKEKEKKKDHERSFIVRSRQVGLLALETSLVLFGLNVMLGTEHGFGLAAPSFLRPVQSKSSKEMDFWPTKLQKHFGLRVPSHSESDSEPSSDSSTWLDIFR
mmetsp:Transcript_28976/g.79484  ORF Transcript_28976/g.79484 Transcript_28976/m.79484 type:complete len:790 (+) Transcript_28976:882-3251(+)